MIGCLSVKARVRSPAVVQGEITADGTQRRTPQGRADEERLTADIAELARQYGQDPSVIQRRPRFGRLWGVPLRAEQANHIWSYDFVEDRTQEGRKFRMLNLIDEFTHEWRAGAPGRLVLDPFGGSGTTLVAAERAGRRARLVEHDARYVGVIVQRWHDVTGRQATLESDGGRQGHPGTGSQ